MGRSFGDAAKGAGKDKGGHREPKVWGGSKPISKKDIKNTGKHGKDKGKGKDGKGGKSSGWSLW